MAAPIRRSPTSSSSPRILSILIFATSSGSSALIRVWTSRGLSRADRPGRGDHGVELESSRYAELRKGAVQVGCDGPGGQVQPQADLAVGEPLGREFDDLPLLRGQCV